jgi:DNA-directed RNA polymerase subunit RPC12/RpoP
MAILKCKMCGREIQATDDTYAICDFCGAMTMILRLNDAERREKANLLALINGPSAKIAGQIKTLENKKWQS